MSATPKQWTVKVVSPPVGPLEVLRDDAPLGAEIGPNLTTPVEVLLVSIGTCFALSCHAAFTLRKLARVGFEVSVTGRKATQPPSRLANIQLEATFDAGLPPEEAEALSLLAKQLCTVTNTLTSEPPCTVSVAVVKQA
ncbi:MAG TPA: OsmC family protein [Steroidobacteraceae bacterium]